ncbi:MAG: hypothetical protein ACC662_03125 [Planctomycetota bacterium]
MTKAPGPVVGVFCAPEGGGADVREFLRVLAALVACGQPCQLVTTGGARDALAGDDLDEEAGQLLEGLAAFGVRPVHLEGPALLARLEGASALLRFGAGDRTGVPSLLAWGRGGDGSEPILNAGQVVLARP